MRGPLLGRDRRTLAGFLESEGVAGATEPSACGRLQAPTAGPCPPRRNCPARHSRPGFPRATVSRGGRRECPSASHTSEMRQSRESPSRGLQTEACGGKDIGRESVHAVHLRGSWRHLRLPYWRQAVTRFKSAREEYPKLLIHIKVGYDCGTRRRAAMTSDDRPSKRSARASKADEGPLPSALGSSMCRWTRRDRSASASGTATAMWSDLTASRWAFAGTAPTKSLTKKESGSSPNTVSAKCVGGRWGTGQPTPYRLKVRVGLTPGGRLVCLALASGRLAQSRARGWQDRLPEILDAAARSRGDG